MHGASKEDIEKLLVLYPNIPDSLLQLLEIVDGIYWRKYSEKEVALVVLSFDMEEYSYYLLSSQQMVDMKDNFWKRGII